MTQISFWGGVGTIGGNKIVISPEDSEEKSILLDFGKDFSIPYLDTFLNPRKFNVIEDYIFVGMIPEPRPGTPFHGLYRKDLYHFKPQILFDLDISVPCCDLTVVETKYSSRSEKYHIVCKAKYANDEETFYFTNNNIEAFSTFFGCNKDDLINLIKDGGKEGSEQINEELNRIIHSEENKKIQIQCNQIRGNLHVCNISDVDIPLDYRKAQEYKRNYEVWNERFGYNPFGEPQISHVLVSHAHSDHITDIRVLDPRVNIVLSKISKEIVDHLEFIQSTSFKDLFRYSEHFQLTPYKTDNRKLKRAYKEARTIKRKFFPLNSGEEMILDNESNGKMIKGAFKIQFFEVDHSIPGAGAFLIQEIASDKRIVYTGDIRLHGPLNQLQKSQKFLEAAKDFHPDIMLCEGTNVSQKLREEGEVENEEAIREQVSNIVQNTQGLIMFACALRDMSRFNSFLKAAIENGRKLAILPTTYKLIERLNYAIQNKDITGDHSNIPRLDENIVPYLQRRGWGLYIPEDYAYHPASRRFFDTESQEEFEKNNQITPTTIDEISQNQSSFVLYLPFWTLFNLIDLRPIQDSAFIHSKSEPFDPEMEIEQEKLVSWLELVGIEQNKFYQVHCSGHGRMKDIEYIINEISPKVVYPIHTNEPELFLSFDLGATKVIAPEYGKLYEI